jgi:phage/plasmid-like protein (TIGR03299 family)
MTGLDAQHAMYAETPWHKLGNVGPIDWEEARHAFAWCEITKTPIYITHYGEQVMLPERNVLKMKYFPIAHAEVSDRYQIVQHQFMADDLTGMLIDTGLVETIESIGTYDNGAVGYVSLKFKDDIVIPGWSTVQSMFNIGNGHDRKVPLIASQSATAVVCANTFKWNILDAEAVFKFKKIGDPQGLMQEAVEELCKGYERQKEYAAQIERMANQEFVNQQWDQLVVDLIGPMPSFNLEAPAFTSGKQNHQGYHNKLTRWSNTKADLNKRFYNDEDIAGVRNTKWGALMAVQAWEQKDKPIKGIKNSFLERNRRHQANVMFGKLPATDKAAKILIKA